MGENGEPGKREGINSRPEKSRLGSGTQGNAIDRCLPVTKSALSKVTDSQDSAGPDDLFLLVWGLVPWPWITVCCLFLIAWLTDPPSLCRLGALQSRRSS